MPLFEVEVTEVVMRRVIYTMKAKNEAEAEYDAMNAPQAAVSTEFIAENCSEVDSVGPAWPKKNASRGFEVREQMRRTAAKSFEPDNEDDDNW